MLSTGIRHPLLMELPCQMRHTRFRFSRVRDIQLMRSVLLGNSRVEHEAAVEGCCRSASVMCAKLINAVWGKEVYR